MPYPADPTELAMALWGVDQETAAELVQEAHRETQTKEA